MFILTMKEGWDVYIDNEGGMGCLYINEGGMACLYINEGGMG